MSYRYGNPRKTDHLVVPIDPETKEAIKTYCFEILEFEKFSECVRYMLKKYFQWARVMEKIERRHKIEKTRKKPPSETKKH